MGCARSTAFRSVTRERATLITIRPLGAFWIGLGAIFAAVMRIAALTCAFAASIDLAIVGARACGQRAATGDRRAGEASVYGEVGIGVGKTLFFGDIRESLRKSYG